LRIVDPGDGPDREGLDAGVALPGFRPHARTSTLKEVVTIMLLRTSKTLLALAAMSLVALPASADVLITEVLDGDLTGGLPKFVEITNTGISSVDLSGYSIGNYNNGSTTLGGSASTVLSGTLGPCESWIISYENSDSPGVGTFYNVYGFDPDDFQLGAFTNGDDVIALFLADGSGAGGAATGDGSDATLVDVYGVIGVDGTGQVWEYTDSYARRNVSTANPTFDDSEWTIAGAGALDGADAQGHRDATDPGVFPPCEGVPTEEVSWTRIKTLPATND